MTSQKQCTSVVRLRNTTEDTTVVVTSQTEVLVDVRGLKGQELRVSWLCRYRQIQLLLLNILRGINTACDDNCTSLTYFKLSRTIKDVNQELHRACYQNKTLSVSQQHLYFTLTNANTATLQICKFVTLASLMAGN